WEREPIKTVNIPFNIRTGIFQTYPEWRVERNITSYKYAGYVQFKKTWFRRLVTNAGLRYDYFKYNKGGGLSPRFGLSYILSDKANLNFGYGYHIQSPSFIELTAHANNKNLSNKKTEQFIIGLEYLLSEDTKCTIEVYDKKYKNVPIPYGWTTADPYDRYGGWIVNKGKGYSRGFEFFLQKKLSKNLQYIVSYAYSTSKGYDERLDSYYDWDYDYRNIFTFIGGYKFRFIEKDWYNRIKDNLLFKVLSVVHPFADETILSFRWRYLGGRPYTMPVYRPELHYWEYSSSLMMNGSRFPAYRRFDFRIDRRYYFNKWNLVTYFDIMNVFGRDNIWDYSYKDNGSVDKILQYETMPVGGIAIEF
ncbi:TonB-dependent receptor, partial [bacterium]|nr:TonB-dependent receptor [bacterium]